MSMVIPPSIQLSAEAALASLADLEAALQRIQRQKLHLEQREKSLMQALGHASQQRLTGLMQESGMGAEDFAGLLRRTVDSSARKTSSDTSKIAQTFVRKAPIRWRHPDEPAYVWSGRGKTPLWMKELERAGRLEEARVTAGPQSAADDEWDDDDDS